MFINYNIKVFRLLFKVVYYFFESDFIEVNFEKVEYD